jgi:type II secretory pathway pseudopilin PulG
MRPTSGSAGFLSLPEALVTLVVGGIVIASTGNLLILVAQQQARSASRQLAADALDLQRVASKASTTPPTAASAGQGLVTTPPAPLVEGCTVDLIDGSGLPSWGKLSARCGPESAPTVTGWATWTPTPPSPPTTPQS